MPILECGFAGDYARFAARLSILLLKLPATWDETTKRKNTCRFYPKFIPRFCLIVCFARRRFASSRSRISGLGAC